MNKIINTDALEGLRTLPDGIVDMCVTSPPYYGLRDYGIEGQIGLEDSPEKYIEKLVIIFQEVKRVLREDGTLWINIGDCYGGGSGGCGDSNNYYGDHRFTKKHDGTRIQRNKGFAKSKDLLGIPWLLAFALRDDGWYLRQDIIWHKLNPMPESVTDRCTKAHEYIFLLSKSEKYYFDNEAIREPVKPDSGKRMRALKSGKHLLTGNYHIVTEKVFEEVKGANKRDVWQISAQPYEGAHFAVFPPSLVRPCILAGSRKNGIVLDPFFGSGTTGVVAVEESRNYIGIELNPTYVELANNRIDATKDKNRFKETTLF